MSFLDVKIINDTCVKIEIDDWTISIDNGTNEKLIHSDKPCWVDVPKDSRISLITCEVR